MAKQRYYVDTRILTACFLAAMPFVAFGSFVVVNMAKGKLRDSVGLSLEQRAIETKLGLEQHMAEQLVQLRLLALDPQVRRALASPAPELPSPEARRLEQAWIAGTDARLAGSIVESEVATQLRAVVTVRPMLKLLQLVDARGRLVAASGRGGRLSYEESAWFKGLAAQEGTPEAWVGDVSRASEASPSFLDIAFPVSEEGGTFRGAVRGLLDATDLYTVLAPVRVGRTGHAVLVRSTDGMILASDDSERILKMIFPGFDSLQGALEGFPLAASGEAIFGKARERRGHWTVKEVRVREEGKGDVILEPARLVGFSPVDQVPNVKWLVAVEQDLAEALAPIEGVTRYLWIHFIGVLAMIILLAVYFSFKLEKPVMEEDFHLHEQHLPAGTRPSEES